MQPKIESIINEMLSPVIKHCGPVRSKRRAFTWSNSNPRRNGRTSVWVYTKRRPVVTPNTCRLPPSTSLQSFFVAVTYSSFLLIKCINIGEIINHHSVFIFMICFSFFCQVVQRKLDHFLMFPCKCGFDSYHIFEFTIV